MKQYCIDNKDTIKDYKKQYRIDNQNKIKEKKKQYYNDNKDKINEKKKVKVECECGSVVRKGDLTRHKKSKKHQNYINIPK